MIVLETNKLNTILQLPWWQRWLLMSIGLVVMLVLFVLGLGMMLLLGVASLLGSLLPSSWRTTKYQQPARGLVETGVCPWCNGELETSAVVDGAQQGKCPDCGRNMNRESLGLVWSPWQASEGLSERRLTSE